MIRRGIAVLIAVAGLIPMGAGVVAADGDPVADRFSFPVGAVPNSPTTSRYAQPGGKIVYMGWAVDPAVAFLSPAYGPGLQPGEDWSGRGGAGTALGQPVYAAAAGTIVAAGYYGPNWGSIVLIRHTLPGGQVVLTQYAYMADIVKSAGTVAWREIIGHVGMGPHGAALHFEVRQGSMLDYPPDYWPSSDNKDADWVRTHYYAPTQFVRTHYRILSPPATAAPVTPTPLGGGTEPSSGGGTLPATGTPGGTEPGSPGSLGNSPGSFPLFPGGQPPATEPPTPATEPPTAVTPTAAWDGVPHLDGTILRSGAGVSYLLQSGQKWRIPNDEVFSTWARPVEAVPATDAELASYPDGSHPLGLRAGTLFRGPGSPACISSDPFDPAGLACWVIENDNVLASLGVPASALKSVSAQTVSLYIRPTPFDQNTMPPRGTLIRKPFGDYYIVEDLSGYLPEVHPVTSFSALHSWQIDESTAMEISGQDFWDRILKLDPVPFRPGAILQSGTGQLYVVSGAYKYAVPSMSVFANRGYNAANAIPVTDAELALEKDAPTPLP